MLDWKMLASEWRDLVFKDHPLQGILSFVLSQKWIGMQFFSEDHIPSIANPCLFLHKWTLDFTLKDDLLRVLPIWVTFPQLPLIFWGEKSIGKIASAIGKPMMTDECTAKKLRVSYARVLIEVAVTIELTNYITIRDPKGNKVLQQVEYEWKPPFCTKCNKVGHDS
jgi:hypothetical protein